MAASVSQKPQSATSLMWQLGWSLSAIRAECMGHPSLRYVEWMLRSVERCTWAVVGPNHPSTWSRLSKLLLTPVRNRDDALAQLTLDLYCLRCACSDARTDQGLLDTYLDRVRDVLSQWSPPDSVHEESNELPLPDLLKPCPVDLETTKPTMFHRAKLYTVSLTCPITSTAWAMRRRFSDFRALHRALQVVFAQCSSSHRDIAWVLRFVHGQPWSKKRWLSCISKTVAQETLLDLHRFGAQLLFVWWLCRRIHRTMHSTDALAKVEALLQSFLQIPFNVSARLDSPLSDDCSVCLTDMFLGAPDTDTLNCGHSFHAECISTWVNSRPKATPATCPLCRRSVIGRASTAQDF